MQNMIRRGKQWIKKLFTLDEGALPGVRPAKASPSQHPGPIAARVPPAARRHPTMDFPPRIRELPVPDPPQLGERITRGLLDRTAACASRKESIRAEMKELVQTYRNSMPPCRLQLFFLTPKGRPPSGLHWVRVARKPDPYGRESLFPSGEKRVRWWKQLTIRKRRDLRSAIYWGGLDKHRKTVMSFYDRYRALNEAHTILARSTSKAHTALGAHLRSTVPAETGPLWGESRFSCPEWFGNAPDVRIWMMGKLIERVLLLLDQLQRDASGLPVRLILSAGPTEADRVVEWEHVHSGRRCRFLRESWIQKLKGPQREISRMLTGEFTRRTLVKWLSQRLGLIRDAESNLAQACLDSDQALEQCPRVSQVPRIQGYD